MKKILTLFLLAIIMFYELRAYTSNNYWMSTFGPNGCIVTDIAEDNDGTIFLGTEGNGLLASTNNGGTWSRIDGDLNLLIINSIAINDSGHIFVSGEDAYFTPSVYRSKDKGLSWTNIYGLPGKILHYNGDTLFVSDKYNGIMRTDNNGDSWVDLNSQPTTPLCVWDIIVDSIGVLWVASPGYVTIHKQGIAESLNKMHGDKNRAGIYKSEDKGLSWINSTEDDIYISTIKITHNGSATLFATGHPILDCSYYKSTDNGNSWNAISDDNEQLSINSLLTMSENTIIGGSDQGIYHSFDYGDTWEKISDDQFDKVNVVREMNNKTIIAGTDYGFMISEDSGITWQDMSGGLPVIPIYTIMPKDSGSIFCGGASAGMFRSTNRGSTWNGYRLLEKSEDSTDIDEINLGNQEIYSIARNSKNRIYIGTSDWGTLYYSDNNGELWSKTRFTTEQYEGEIWSLAVDDSNYVYMGTNGAGVYIKRDDSQEVSCSGIPFGYIRALFVANDQTIYAATYFKGFFYSKDRGKSWISSSNGLPENPIYSININDGGTIYAGLNGGLFASYDSASTWHEINGDLYNMTILSIYLSDYGELFLGTDGNGVLYSSNSGESFMNLSQGLKNSTIWDIKLDTESYLFAATDSGVHVSTSPVSSITASEKKTPGRFILFPNYPNPFNSSTIIKYYLPSSSQVDINIYNSIGQKIEALVKIKQNKGTYTFKWEGTSYPSGIYYLRIRTQFGTMSKKMIMIR